MRHIGYKFNAAAFCISCTLDRYPHLNDDTVDDHGNPIHPVFDIDENSCGDSCNDCLEYLWEIDGIERDCEEYECEH